MRGKRTSAKRRRRNRPINRRPGPRRPSSGLADFRLQKTMMTVTGVMFCMQEDKLHTGKLVHQAGNVGKSVKTNFFDSELAHSVVHGHIGLESMSTVDIFADRRLLRNVCYVKEIMYIACNAGTVVVLQKGELPGYGPVWYHEGAIANYSP